MVQVFSNYGTAVGPLRGRLVRGPATRPSSSSSSPSRSSSGWAGRGSTRSLKKALIALTVLSVMFSTMHQSALGSLFLIAPDQAPPALVLAASSSSSSSSPRSSPASRMVDRGEQPSRTRSSRDQFEGQHVDVDKLTLGLGKAGAVVMFAYFFLKLQGVIDGHAWGYLATGYGAWFLVEIVGLRARALAAVRLRRPQRQGAAASASPAAMGVSASSSTGSTSRSSPTTGTSRPRSATCRAGWRSGSR